MPKQIFRYLKKLKRTSKKIEWKDAPDIYHELSIIASRLNLAHIDLTKIKAVRSFGSKAYARARIWSFPKVWQQVLNLPPYYIIEVISEKFDHLSSDDKKRVLIHELLHIPKNFSGSLVSHKGRYHSINYKTVEKLFNKFRSRSGK